MNTTEGRPIEILLVEDSPSDTDLTVAALAAAVSIPIIVAKAGPPGTMPMGFSG